MNIQFVNRNRLCLAVALLSMGACVSVSSLADGNKSIEQLEHKEKSTLETFGLNAIEEAELSEAVIAGGLEPTSAGGRQQKREQPVAIYEDASLLLPQDRQTDLGRYEIPVTLNYSEPRQIPGSTWGSDYSITPDAGNRHYEQYNTNTYER